MGSAALTVIIRVRAREGRGCMWRWETDYLTHTTHRTWERSKGTDFQELWGQLQTSDISDQSFRKRQ